MKLKLWFPAHKTLEILMAKGERMRMPTRLCSGAQAKAVLCVRLHEAIDGVLFPLLYPALVCTFHIPPLQRLSVQSEAKEASYLLEKLSSRCFQDEITSMGHRTLATYCSKASRGCYHATGIECYSNIKPPFGPAHLHLSRWTAKVCAHCLLSL